MIKGTYTLDIPFEDELIKFPFPGVVERFYDTILKNMLVVYYVVSLRYFSFKCNV